MRKVTVMIDEELRRIVAEFLPDALAKAIASYEKRMTESEVVDAKGFAEFHADLKKAAAHIELLVKLAERVGLPSTKVNDAGLLSAMLREASEQLSAYRSLPIIEADWVESGEE